jgi:hypothetical protein
VRESKCSINQKFIIEAIRAFLKHKFENLFYLTPESSSATDYYRQDLIAGQAAKEKITSSSKR